MTETQEYLFERMRPGQVRAARQRMDIAFLPLGALEWHGVHNPLGLDAIKAQAICVAAARKLGGGAVFPPLVWGVPRDSFFVGTSPLQGDIAEPIAAALGTDAERFRGFCAHGGMDVQEQWLFYQRLLRMSLEQIAGFGFRSIYMLSGHNPLVHWARPTAVAFIRASQMARQPVNVWFGGEFDAAGLSGDHGGRWETSMAQAIDPAMVDLGELDRNPQYKGVGCNLNAPEATAEQGRAWIDQCAEGIAREARRLVEVWPDTPLKGHAR